MVKTETSLLYRFLGNFIDILRFPVIILEAQGKFFTKMGSVKPFSHGLAPTRPCWFMAPLCKLGAFIWRGGKASDRRHLPTFQPLEKVFCLMLS